MTMTGDFNLDDAVVLYLKRFPGSNEHEFNAHYGSASDAVRAEVKLLLREAMQIEPDWNRLSLDGAGDYVESVMHVRYPELTTPALDAIGNYFTYAMR